MSTINKLEQALAGAKGLASQFKTFSLDTDDQNAKQMFNQLSQNAEDMAQQLEGRVEFVKNEEPQYRQEPQ
jgi:hypothetical protein